MDDMYEEEPRRRAWGAIASVVLALALVFVGYQWNQTASRAEALGAQVNGLRAEAETQRLRAEDAQRQVDVIQKRLAAMSAEKDSLAERIAMLEKAGARRVPWPRRPRSHGRRRPQPRRRVGRAPRRSPLAPRRRSARRSGGRRHPARARSSAASSRAFCSRVPTLTRRCSG